MITETFENASEEIIKVTRNPQAIKVDACIITFSNEISITCCWMYVLCFVGCCYTFGNLNSICNYFILFIVK